MESQINLNYSELQPLRYIMDRTAQQAHTIMTVPDVQMRNFMCVHCFCASGSAEGD